MGQRWVKSLNLKWLLGLGVALSLGAGFVTWQMKPAAVPTVNLTPTTPSAINALGRLEPQGEVIKLSAPSQSMGGSQVVELRVNEGDRVQPGQIIAVLDSRDRLQASLIEAQNQIQGAQARRAQVQAGAKRGELAAAQAEITNLAAQREGEQQTQQATIVRLKATWQNAETELRRNQALFQVGAIAATTLDSRKLAVETAQAQLNEAIATADRTQRTLTAQIQKATATLAQTAEVRPTDINTAQAEVDRAIAAMNRIQTELDQSYVRATKAGRILKIRTKAGETVGSNGIVELAASEQMMAIAEVYESDIAKVRPGQTATITSPSNVFTNRLKGTVMQISNQIAKKDILNDDPTAATDARVIEVKIRLDKTASRQVESLINLQVNVEIKP
jgi:HlyD family secretion protein